MDSRIKPWDSKGSLYIRTFLENVATFLWRIKKYFGAMIKVVCLQNTLLLLFILISSRSCTCALNIEAFFEVETEGKERSSNDQQNKWWETNVDGLWKKVTQEEDEDPGKHGC